MAASRFQFIAGYEVAAHNRILRCFEDKSHYTQAAKLKPVPVPAGVR